MGVFEGAVASISNNNFQVFGDSAGARTVHVLVDSAAEGTEVVDNMAGQGVEAVTIAVQNQSETAQVIIKDTAGVGDVEYPPSDPYLVTDAMKDGVGMVGPGGGPPE